MLKAKFRKGQTVEYREETSPYKVMEGKITDKEYVDAKGAGWLYKIDDNYHYIREQSIINII